jgi:hypothetical protein
MDISVIAVRNLAAVQTFIAAVGGEAGSFDRLQAVQSFRQIRREQFQFIQRIAREQVGMAKAAASEGALQQLHALRLTGEIFEGHWLLLVERFRFRRNTFDAASEIARANNGTRQL